MNLFEITDKSGRKLRLTKRQWSHIRKKHPEVENFEDIEQTLKNPLKIINYSLDETIAYYYKYFKHRIFSDKYLLVLVKYLNGEGYIITAYFEEYIR